MTPKEALQSYYAALKRHAQASRADEERAYAELSAAEDSAVTARVFSLEDVEAKLSFICAQLEKENGVVAIQAAVLLRLDVRTMLKGSAPDPSDV